MHGAPQQMRLQRQQQACARANDPLCDPETDRLQIRLFESLEKNEKISYNFRNLKQEYTQLFSENSILHSHSFVVVIVVVVCMKENAKLC